MQLLGAAPIFLILFLIAGIEKMHMISKAQMDCPAGSPASAANQF